MEVSGDISLTKSGELPVFYRAKKVLNPRLYPIIAMISVIVLTDVLSRLVPTSDTEHDALILDSARLSERVFFGSESYAGYIDRLKEFDVHDSISDMVNPISDEVELVEQELGYWQLDKSKYRLVSVLKGKERMALVEKADVATGQYEIIKVLDGDQFEDFRVVSIGRQSLTVVSQVGDRVELRLFEKVSAASKGAM
jgi:hypothetical protein